MTTQPGGPAGLDGEPVPPAGSFAGIVLAIYHDLVANALHEVVHEAHRSEKLLRTQQMQLTAAMEAPKPTSATDDKPPEVKPMVNPMTVFPKEIICPKCKLPRHTHESLANGNTGGKDDKKKYCTKVPFQNRPLHDIYGNPFPSVNTSATQKKAKAAAAAAQANENMDSSADTPPGETPVVSIANGRKPDSLVFFKCSNCQQEKIHAPRFAAHLDKCLMLAGRKSSRTAMAKISGGSGSGSGAASPALASDSMVGAGSITVGKVTAKPAVDATDMESLRKERTASFTVENEGINVPPPPALSTALPKVATPAPKKKKKAPAKDPGVTVPAPRESSAPIIKDTTRPSTPIIASASLPVKEPPSSTKKRKRKPETADGAAGSPPPPMAKVDSTQGIDERDASITVTSVTPNRPKPPLKKQKTDIPPPDGALLKKNPISKFKDRDSPGPAPVKKLDSKRDSSAASSGKFPPSKGAKSPPPQAKAASPIPAKHPPSASPKPSPAKLAAVAKGTKKAAPSADAATRKVKPPTSANGTPKMAKKSLPGVGVNVPAPGKIPGKSLPKPIVPIDAAVPPPPSSAKKDMSPEKVRKPLTNGALKASGTPSGKPKLQKASALGGSGGTAQRPSAPSKTVPGKTLPGKRAVPAVGAAGDRDPDGGIPRKRPKVGE